MHSSKLLTYFVFVLSFLASGQIYEPTSPFGKTVNGNFLRVNTSGVNILTVNDGLFKHQWILKNGIWEDNNLWVGGPIVDEKELYKEELYGGFLTPLGENLYLSYPLAWKIDGKSKSANHSSKIKNGKVEYICDDVLSNNQVVGKEPLISIRGIFPLNDANLYFSGKRNTTMGVYRFLSANPKTGSPLSFTTYNFEEIFLTEPEYNILQVWPDGSGNFIGERYKSPATSMETEIVHYSDTGEKNVLVSNNYIYNQKINAVRSTQCCSLVVDANTRTYAVSYKKIDNLQHIAMLDGTTLKDVYTTSSPARVVAQRGGKHILVASGQQKDVWNTLIKVDVETGRATTLLSPSTVIPGFSIPSTGLNLQMMDIDNSGTVWVGLTTNSGLRVYALMEVFLDQIPTTIAGNKVILNGNSLVKKDFVSTVFVDGKSVPTTVEDGKLSFIAPITVGKYNISVKLEGNDQTTESNKQSLDVILPPAPIISLFKAEPATIIKGQSTMLSWTTANATEVLIDKGVGKVDLNGSIKVSPYENTVYTLTAKGLGGTVMTSLIVTVNPYIPPVKPAKVEGIYDLMYKPINNVAPGQLFLISGQNLTGFRSAVPLPPNFGSVPLPTKLADSEVFMCGKAIPMLIAITYETGTVDASGNNSGDKSLIFAQAPTDAALGSCPIVVRRWNLLKPEIDSNITQINIVPTAPMLWRHRITDGSTLLTVFNQTKGYYNVLVTANNPAERGDVLEVWGSGFGLTNPVLLSGHAAKDGKTNIQAKVTVLLRSQEGQYFEQDVQFTVASPQFPGMVQLAFGVRSNTPPGVYRLILVVGDTIIGEITTDPLPMSVWVK